MQDPDVQRAIDKADQRRKDREEGKRPGRNKRHGFDATHLRPARDTEDGDSIE